MSVVLLAGCVILKDRRLLLIRKKGKDFWELPGGIVPNREDDEKAAVDKTTTQIGVAPAVIQQFTMLEYQVGGRNMEASIFECDVDPDATFHPGENVDDVKWFDLATINEQKLGEDVKDILDDLSAL